MNITLSPQSFYHKQNLPAQKPSFTSNYQVINNRRPYCTYFFREDLKWKSFAKYLERRFKGTEKVNVYNAACSDGTESYALIMSLIKHLGKEKAEKFFPVKAFDLNSQLIEIAKSGEIPLLSGIYRMAESLFIKLNMMFKEDKYFKYVTQPDGKRFAKFDDNIKDLIEFRRSNIFNEIARRNKNEENSVFLCRNMWMYLTDPEQEKLASMLSEFCGKNSVVVLGEYDLSTSKAGELLLKNGFEETYIDKVYEKMV